MPKIAYINQNFHPPTRRIIEAANQIIEEYQAAGYVMTLRQLYYQFVARDLIKNMQKEYKRLAGIINDARLAGLVDWDAIEDRTRNLSTVSSWDGPQDILNSAANSFRLNPWEEQRYIVEVWVEKEALAAVVERAATKYRAPFFCCRGYTSQSELHSAALRLLRYIQHGKHPVILHLGDHDPSGIDMSRDIIDRFNLFLGAYGHAGDVMFERIALNMDQVDEFNPPPNPAKVTDSRFETYQSQFGNESWELDALDPPTLNELISKSIENHIHFSDWNEVLKLENSQRRNLVRVADNWASVEDFVEDLDS